MKNSFISQKNLYLFFLLMSILISLSSNSILGIWMGLEINMMSVIPLFSMGENYKNETSLMLYFLIQSVSSMMLIVSFLNMNIFNQDTKFFWILFMIAIFMKMGFFPFYIWIPSVMEGLSWFNCFILSTIQKIIPLMILFSMITQKIILIFCVINSLIASLSGMNQFSMRKIMSFSSMNHLSLITISIFLSKSLFKMYLLVYTIMTAMAFNYLYKLNMNYIFQMMNLTKANIFYHLNFIIIILSMAGTPPFLGFFPKMMIMLKLLECSMFIPSILIMSFNVMATYFYLKMTISMFFMTLSSLKFNKTNEVCESNIYSIMMIVSPMIFFMWDFKLKNY